MGALPFIDR